MFDEYRIKLQQLFSAVDEAQRQIAYDTIDDYIFYLQQNETLKKLPQIRVSSANPALQQRTQAAKMLKDNSQTVCNLRKILLMILYRSGAAGDDNQLINILRQFE